MKVLNTRKINDKISELMDFNQLSSTVNTAITQMINRNSMIPRDTEALRKEAKQIQKQMPEYSVDQIMMLTLVEGMIDPYLSNQPDAMEFFMNWLAAESKVFDVKEFNENPYIKNIDFTNKSNGDYELTYLSDMPYELNFYDVPKRLEEICVDIPRISCFPEEFHYPGIFQNSIKSTWMSVSPNEVFTMKHPIQNAKGKVLTLGCGMGYFAYMASLKDEVESVTIIELEQSVIDLFESCLLPQFSHKEKITVIKGDAIEFLKNIQDGDYDYCFADIWIGVGDIAPYFAVKEVGRTFRKTKMEYWIEESFAILLTSYVWIEILKGFSESIGYKAPPIDESLRSDTERRIENYIHKLMINEKITRPAQIDYFMRPQNVIRLIDQTNLIF